MNQNQYDYFNSKQKSRPLMRMEDANKEKAMDGTGSSEI